MIYDSAAVYIEGATSLCDKIARIDQVIDGLLSNALKAVETDNIEEYSINNGQSVIKTRYNTTASVMNSINAFEKLKHIYVNRLNGRVVRLVDGKNLNGRKYGR